MPKEPSGLTRRSGRMGRAHTKVVATIGPASEDLLGELIDAGMSVARINFSHGGHEDHRRRIGLVRAAAQDRELPVGILADISGPKLRLGHFPGGIRELAEGELVRLREGDGVAEEGEIRFDFTGLTERLEVGHRVFLADGVLELEVEENREGGPLARVLRGGRLSDRKGVHLPDTELSQEVPTEKDLEDLALARELDVDLVGVSYVGRAAEIRRVRELVPEAQIVAKIERSLALRNLREILEASDGIMVARGDLGVELQLEQLPLVQKSLIQDALKAGRFAITATEMLESMVTSSRPTRAEVADVANAVFDGTDALMLSAETAVGQHPVEAVATMDRIARVMETSERYSELPSIAFRSSEPTFSNATALAAAQAADALGLGRILCFTETGNTVRLLSRYRPRAQVIGMTPHRRTLGHLTVLAHVRPVLVERQETLEDMLETACRLLTAQGIVVSGEEVVFVAGVPPGVARSTNVMKLHRIGEPVKLA